MRKATEDMVAFLLCMLALVAGIMLIDLMIDDKYKLAARISSNLTELKENFSKGAE